MGTGASFARVIPRSIQGSAQSKCVVEQELDFIDRINTWFRPQISGLSSNLSIRFLHYFGTTGMVFEGTSSMEFRIEALATKEARTANFREYSRQSAHNALEELKKDDWIKVKGRKKRANQGIRIEFTQKLLDLIDKSLKKSRLKLVPSPPSSTLPTPVEKENKKVVSSSPSSLVAGENKKESLEILPKPYPTSEHTITHVKKFDTYNMSIRGISQDPNTSIQNKDTRAIDNENVIEFKKELKEKTEKPGTRTKPKKKSNKKKFYSPKKLRKQDHSVLWSTLQTGHQDGSLSGRDFEAALHRGWLDIFRPDLLAPTGIDWEFSRGKWSDLGRYGRDEYCRGHILPALLSSASKSSSAPSCLDKITREYSHEASHERDSERDNRELCEYKESIKRIKYRWERGEISDQDALIMIKATQHLFNVKTNDLPKILDLQKNG